jgi:hypothetical protein
LRRELDAIAVLPAGYKTFAPISKILQIGYFAVSVQMVRET